MSRTLLIVFLSITLLLAGLMPAAAQASTIQNHWTKCVLTYGAGGGFQSKACYHIAMPSEHRQRIGHTWHERPRQPLADGGYLSVRITYPIFYPQLTSCTPAIRQWRAAVGVANYWTHVPVWVITGVIAAESGGSATVPTTPDGWGGPGDIGLMQFGLREANLVRATYGFGGFSADPTTNVLTGAGYLLYLYQHDAGYNWYTAVQEYNGGPGNPYRPSYLAMVEARGCSS